MLIVLALFLREADEDFLSALAATLLAEKAKDHPPVEPEKPLPIFRNINGVEGLCWTLKLGSF